MRARAITWVALLLAALAVARALLVARPTVGGDDFYDYVSFARDLASGATDVPPTRWLYSPGVYAFWRTAIRLFGPSLPALQWTCLALLGANGALAGAIVARGAGRAAGALAGLGVLALATRLQGFEGCTEPLATLPVLLAVLVWDGRALDGRGGAARVAALGAGLGLAAYSKQQGVLLAAGLLVFAPGLVASRAPRDWAHAALAPAVAALVFLGGVLLEGEGLGPLGQSLRLARSYQAHGSFFANVGGARPNTVTLVLALAVAATIAWALLRRSVRSPALDRTGFLALAALGTFVQFGRRDYAHYALLGAPFAVAAAVLAASELARRSPRVARAGPAAGVLLALAVLVVAVRVKPVARWRDDPAVASDLAALRALVRPGEELAVIPPRHNEVHFELGTRVRAAAGYHFGAELALGPPPWESAAAVVVADGRGYSPEREPLEDAERPARVRALEQLGFRPVQRLAALTLYRR